MLRRPLPIARHRAIFQSPKDSLSVSTHILVIPEIENKLHRLPVILAKQWLNILRKPGRIACSGHIPSLLLSIRKTIASDGFAIFSRKLVVESNSVQVGINLDIFIWLVG